MVVSRGMPVVQREKVSVIYTVLCKKFLRYELLDGSLRAGYVVFSDGRRINRRLVKNLEANVKPFMLPFSFPVCMV